MLDLAAVALAAEQVGGAQKCLDMAVEYAKVRVQFGRPIGSFQAIKHKCADMLLEVESAKSAAYYAGWCASELNDELPSVASLAKAYCSEAYFHAAGREHPDPRWHRLHLGAPGAPLLQAGQVVRAAVRRPHLPPRAARPAHRICDALAPALPPVRGATPMIWIFVALTIVSVVVVIALVAVGREALGGATPRRALRCSTWRRRWSSSAEGLPSDVASRLTYDDVRWVLRTDVDALEEATAEAEHVELGMEVLDEDIAIGRILEVVDAEGRDLTDVDVASVLQGRTRYLRAIGAIGPEVVGDPDGDAENSARAALGASRQVGGSREAV